MDFSAPVVSMFYSAEINRVVLITFKGINLYEPFTAQKEELEIIPNCIYLSCTRNPEDNDLLLAGYQSDDNILKSICIYLDLVTQKSHLFEIEGEFKGACKEADREYSVKTTQNLYKVTPSSIEISEMYKDSEAALWLLDKWPNGDLIFLRTQNNTKYLVWDGIEIEVGCLNDSLVCGKYLWVFDNKKNNLSVYDCWGRVIKKDQLEKRVSGCGKIHDGGIWVFYSDFSIDIFKEDGERVSSECLDIRL
ncbi:MAG: hypothetical protein WHS88_12595 [Anaerohalosphaeraceae bacterium]